VKEMMMVVALMMETLERAERLRWIEGWRGWGLRMMMMIA